MYSGFITYLEKVVLQEIKTLKMKFVVLSVGIILCLYLLMIFLLWHNQERLIFHPQPISSQDRNRYAHFETQYIAKDGTILKGWLVPPADSSTSDQVIIPEESFCQLLIYFGGNSEEVSHHLDINRFPFFQLYVNYRGYGDSGGVPSAHWLRQDALLLYDETLKRLSISPDRICILGRSLGTHMAVYVAAKRQIGKLVLVSPYDSITRLGMARYPIFPIRYLIRHHFDSVVEAPSVKSPTLVLLSEHDRVVPHAHTYKLIRHWQAPLIEKIIANTIHSNMDVPKYWQTLYQFLTRRDNH